MKKRINFLNIVILVLIIMIGGTACMESPEEIESSSNSTSSSQSSEASSSTEATEITTISDKQIIEAILTDFHSFLSKEDITKYVDEAISRTGKLSDRYLGSIPSEENAKVKAEAVWIEIDKGIFENFKEKHGNEKQPYIEAFFYEKYDVWYLKTITSGIMEDGQAYGVTGGFQIVIRKSDGKVLAAWYD